MDEVVHPLHPAHHNTNNEVVPRDFLCCLLCREEYQDPKFLPCLHSFCKACIDDHIQATTCTNTAIGGPDQHCHNSNNHPQNLPLCPVCGTPIHPTDYQGGKMAELPDNVLARRLSCPLMVPDQRELACTPCQTVCGVRTEATTHCINCDEPMCRSCSAGHLAQKETSSHRTQSIDNLDAGNRCHTNFDTNSYAMAMTTQLPDAFVAPIARCCRLYDALDIGSTFCVDCDMATCTECHAREHIDHRCAELTAIAHNFETKIQEPLKELKKDSKKLKRELLHLSKVKQHVTRNQQELKRQAEERSNMLWSMIQQYESILSLEIEKRHSQNMTDLEAQEEIIRRHLASLEAVTDLTDKLLTFGSQEEKVSMRRRIGRRVRELCESDLPPRHARLKQCVMSQPPVTVESICDMFGELAGDSKLVKSSNISSSSATFGNSHSIDLSVLRHGRSGRHSLSSTDDVPEELAELDDYEEGEDTDMLSASNTSDILRSEGYGRTSLSNSAGEDQLKLSQASSIYSDQLNKSRRMSQNKAFISNVSFQSSVAAQNDVPCHNLGDAKREMRFPDTITPECIKGVGVTPLGDIVVGTVSPAGQSKVFILEKRGIVRGQIEVEKNWGIHSVATDGKVSLTVSRSDNRYKVRVVTPERNALVDAHIESFGMNGVTATSTGTLLVTSTRYPSSTGRSAKLGGNVSMFESDGTVRRIITNECFTHLGMHLFDRPHHLSVDNQDNFFVADPGRHSVIGFKSDGDFMFEYGNTDAEEELYQGPDAICTDRYQNVIVLDKKDGRIDVLNYEGELLRCYFPSEHVRFFSITPDKNLLLVTSDGLIKFYDYIN